MLLLDTHALVWLVDAIEVPEFHPDPADRMIVASARAVGAGLVTADDRILTRGGSLVRHDARR